MDTRLIEQLAAAPLLADWGRPWAASPDGSTVAFQWYRDGDWQIFVMDLAGGEPHRIGSIDDACSCPLFSADGRGLYFSRDDRGSECFDVYRYDFAGGALENLLPDTPELAPLPDFDLSPDGTGIALTVADGDGYAVAVMPASGAPGGAGIRHLSRHPYTETSPIWSPDGRRLAVAAGTRGQDTAVFLIDAASGEQEIVGGDDHFVATQPAWSPDGRLLVFSGGPGDHPAIGLFDVAGGAVSWAWRGDLDAHHPAWSPDGSKLAFLVDCEAETGLVLLDLRSGMTSEMSIGAGNHYVPGFLPDGSLLCVFSPPTRPSDLYRIDVPVDDETAETARPVETPADEVADDTAAAADDVAAAATRVTDSLPAELRDVAFAAGFPVRFTSRDRLTSVPGLLVEPAEPNGAGVVIVHGGPTWHHSNEWDPLRQAFIAAGVTVMHPNYRGSDGYGRTWQNANRFLMGQGEAQDVAAAWDVLVGQGCDPARVAVTGRSWGGFMTMAMVTQFPGLWAAGVAGVPFFDFIDSMIDPTVREDLRWWDSENTGDPVKDRAKLEYYSPVNHLDRIEAPLLLLAGELDVRCPPRQTREVAAALQARGKLCEVVVYPDEGHEISGLEHRIDYDRRTVSFILEHTGVTS